MTQKFNQTLREAWRQRIARHRRSGLTVAEFSRQEGVSTASFYRWQQTLGSAAPRQREPSASARRLKMAVPSVKANQSARPDAAFVQLPLPPSATHPWIELTLNDGTLIRLPQQR